MNYSVEQQLSTWAREAFAALFPELPKEAAVEVVAATDDAFGDYQCNAPMGLAKALRRAPRAIAEEVVAKADLPPAIARLEVAGPGFLNIRLHDAWLVRHLEAIDQDDRLGVPLTGHPETIVLDYSSPNIAKPMHIGHIRSTVIGNALDRMLRHLGHRVISDNHLGDWGTQFGILIMGYRHFCNEEALAADPIAELERLYVRSNEEADKDEAWREQARRELVKLQQGDKENRSLWRTFVELSLHEFNRMYERLGVSFDLVRGESYYHDRLTPVLEQLDAHGLLEQSEGAWVVNLEAEKLPICLVRKSDGGFNYATTDIATVISRVEEFQPDRILYITDERQQLHFKQFFAVCRRLGINTSLIHIWFGLMRLPEATFSTRQGNVIKLERLLDEAEARALELVRQSSPDMPESQQREVARAVGIGAVKYADLSQNPQSLVTFTWEKAMALEGNSAPYLQYAVARVASVQDKYRERHPDSDLRMFPYGLPEPVERLLAIRLIRFPDVLARAANQYRPNLLADYLFELAQLYSRFYQNVPFLKAEEGTRESRVRLCGLVCRTLRTGLHLLGIDTPNRI
ncbi:MAG TPA: arginine--tRNA ligase [Kiritimatiellia bacterium]|nr:arginine--tRNA ligase [Kiritimatiellia bacterium]HMP95624.1 arginine--tRNA ligase [Kiritimatiellia bacterium]